MKENPLKEIQRELLFLLTTLDGICRENSIKYYITAGSLLGAVREGGFIPWDDDCDVVMKRGDFRKFLKVMRKKKDAPFAFQDRRAEKKYPYAFVKIRSRGVGARECGAIWEMLCGGCYVDVFPLDKCPKNPRRAERFFRFSELFTSVILAKGDKNFVCGYKNRLARGLFALLLRLPSSVSLFLREAVRIYYSLTSSGDMLATVYGSYGYPRESYKAEWFCSQAYLLFEGRHFPAPIGYREILSNMYGDYMTPPNENNRHTHLKGDSN